MPGARLVLDAAGAVPVSASLQRPAGAAAVAAGELVDSLGHRMPSAAVVSDRLRAVAHAARAFGAGQADVSAVDSARDTRENAAGLDEETIRARIRYDEFFHVRRVAGLSAGEFRLGVLDTVARTCEDLAAAPVGLAELTDLARGVRALLAAVAGGDVASAPLQAAADGDDQGDRAMRRWVTGHHVFALCCGLGRHHLERAARGLERLADPDAVADDLRCAELMVRAVGAAMCYAATLPRSLYVRHVRPLMDAASGTAHGFSGVDNYDYLLLRECWERLHHALAAFPSLPHSTVGSAAIGLYAAIVEENERHTLIAAAMVGSDPSLKQAREATIPDGHGTPAVEALRQNTDQRRELLEALTARFGSLTLSG